MSLELGDDHRIVGIVSGLRVLGVHDAIKADVFIDTAVLRHCKLDIVLVGGFGPDAAAPRAYKTWAGGDLAFCYYGHPRDPNIYVRPDFRVKLNSSELGSELKRHFGDEIIDRATDSEVCLLVLSLYR